MVDWPRRRAHLGSWETLDDAERAWLIGSRRAARRRTALVVGWPWWRSACPCCWPTDASSVGRPDQTSDWKGGARQVRRVPTDPDARGRELFRPLRSRVDLAVRCGCWPLAEAGGPGISRSPASQRSRAFLLYR